MTNRDLALECARVLRDQSMAPEIVVIGKLPVKGWPRGRCVGSSSRGQFWAYPAARVLARFPLLMEYTEDTVQVIVDDQPYHLPRNGPSHKELEKAMREVSSASSTR
jgi:hypothetical protein